MKFFVKSHIAEERLAICRGCDQLSEHNLCKKCGCYMPIKVKMGWVDCPLKKWDKSDEHDPKQPVVPPKVNSPEPETKDEIIIVP